MHGRALSGAGLEAPVGESGAHGFGNGLGMLPAQDVHAFHPANRVVNEQAHPEQGPQAAPLA
jgi:hypothetical protein